MQIAPGLKILEISAPGEGMVVHPVLIWDDKDVILIDAGMPNMAPAIKEAIAKSGVPFERLNKVIITHHDFDHLGGLTGILTLAQQKISVLAHEDEKPFIEGKKHLWEKIEKTTASLPPAQKEENKIAYRNRETVEVNMTLSDGQQLPFCGGITVIHTPGHTPGHICLYLPATKTLIAGDALNSDQGKLMGPIPMFTVDQEQAVASLKKLLSYEIDRIICYHGGLVQGDMRAQLEKIIF
ncbi:MAG: MBL fold metallo-hydrolase [Firmicutes bacterium]|nr:MBL fold metallo-hydrolase [Bacillota bacterium]